MSSGVARNFQVLALHAILANQKTMRHLNAMGGNFWRVGALLGLVLVSGCQTEQPATSSYVPPTNEKEWCAEAAKLLGNPWGEDWQKAALFEKMRNRGCMN